MFLAVIGIMYDSSRSLQQMLSDSIHQTLNESAVQQSFNLRQKMEADINALHNIAFQLEEFSEEDMGAYLDKVVQNTGFSVLGLVDADGIGIDNERFLEIPYTNRRYVEMLWLERRLSLYLQTNQSSLYWFQF